MRAALLQHLSSAQQDGLHQLRRVCCGGDVTALIAGDTADLLLICDPPETAHPWLISPPPRCCVVAADDGPVGCRYPACGQRAFTDELLVTAAGSIEHRTLSADGARPTAAPAPPVLSAVAL
jgi:hypothetical protein